MNNHIYFVFVLFAILFTSGSRLTAQDFRPLVQRAWDNNEQLKSKNFQIESAVHAMKESRSMFGPNVVFGTQYTLAAGGRSIDFPVGDLLNPVYSTLNKITATNTFPQIENVNTTFLPNNFYDARFRITQPIYYPDLIIQKKLKYEAVALKTLEVKAFKRQISKEVMIACFQLETSKKAIEIYAVSDTLLTEARRTTQSMIRNGIALPSALSRIDNQIAAVKAQQIEAASNHMNALSYFEFVLGDRVGSGIPELPELPPSDIQVNGQREEIQQISQGIKMQNLAVQKEDQFYLPRIGVQVEGGSQAFDFGFQPYILAGLNLEINIFDTNRHKHRKEAAKADILSAEHHQSYVIEQIALQTTVVKNNLISAVEQAKTFKSRITAAEKIYREVLQKYKEGTANYLELLDAETQITLINIQYVLARQNAWTKWAEYVYVAAAFPID